MAGVALLGVAVTVTVPFSAGEAQAEIRNSTVAPGCTVLWAAVTLAEGAV
jgi:hypothetical protein